jgi:ubiquinone/menaquinone biosynthesis C-methylase UbiE
MAKFDHFNLFGPIYDWVFGKSTNHKILELADLAQEHRLLDAGGGQAGLLQRLSSITPHVVVADSAVKMLQKARQKGLIVINAHLENLPFSQNNFDCIIMVDAFHHVEDQQKTLTELWRTLKPGGRLIIEEPNIKHWMVKIIALAEKLMLMRSHFRKPEELIMMCNFADEGYHDLQYDAGIAWVIIEKKSY